MKTGPLRKTNHRRWAERRNAILNRDHHRCRYCDAPATEVDHIIAIAAGGTDDHWNLVACCWPCNHGANVTVKLELLERRGGGGIQLARLRRGLRPHISLPAENEGAWRPLSRDW